MNLIQLRYFVKTAQLLNYSRAAEELLVARQSLRQSIAALEEEIGRPLFINTKNHLSLTEYGAYLALAGQETLDAFDRMEEGLNRLISRSSGLNLGFSTTLAPFSCYLPSDEARSYYKIEEIEPTGIVDIRDAKNSKDTKGVYYDVSGRKVSSMAMKPGIYIKEGKKVVLR